MGDIAKDVTIRASIQDDTKKGADSVARNIGAAEKAWEEASAKTAKIQETARRKHQEGGGGGGEKSHFGRIFGDKSTTGLGTLERGLLSGFGDKLGGAMKLGAVAVVGAALESATGKAVEFSNKLAKGESNAADITNDFLKAIPIIGSFASAGNNLNEVFFHTKRNMELTNAATESTVAQNDRLLSISLRINEAVAVRAELTRSLSRQAEGVPLRGSDAERFGIQSQVLDVKGKAVLARQTIKDAITQGDDIKGKDAEITEFEKKYGIYTELGANMHKERQKLFAKLMEAHKAEMDKIDAEETGNLAILGAQDKETAKRRGERLTMEAGAAGTEHARARGDIAAGAAGVAGDVGASKRQAVQASIAAEESQARLAAESRTNATTNAEERKIIASQLETKLADIRARGAVQLAAVDKEISTTRRKAMFDTAMADQDATAYREAQRLREVGRGYDAERTLRQQELTRRKAEIDQAAKEEIVQNRDNAEQILTKAAADKKSLDAQYAEKARQADETRREGQFGTAKDIMQGRITELEGQARAGDIAAASEAKRLSIIKEFAERRAALNKLIRDPDVAAAEKAAAQNQLNGLDAQEALAQRLAMFTGGSGVPGLNIMSHSSGRAARAREENSDYITLRREMALQTSSRRESTKATNDLIKTLTGKNNELKFLFNGGK